MKSVYEIKISKMIGYYEELKREFKWESDLSRHLVALNFANKDKILNTDNIKDLQDYIKKETGMFSIFRGQMMFAISGLLCATSDTPKTNFEMMLKNEKVLKSVGFKNSSYLPTALYALSTVYVDSNVLGFSEKAIGIYKDMKQNHPFLTSGDDYALAILLASSSHSPDLLETYYKTLNAEGFAKCNGLQMLSHIMSFSMEDVNYSVTKCKRIYDELKNNKFKVHNDYYPAIGLVSLLDNQDEIIADLIEVAIFLRNQKKYKWLAKDMIILMASALITSEYIKESNGDVVATTVSISIQAIIAAQQAAMIAAVTASTAAASSAT